MAHASLFEKYGGYQEDLKVGEDQEILIRFAHSIKKEEVSFINRLGYLYRNNPDGVCATRWDEVKNGYLSTMLTLMKMQNKSFTQCRHGGTVNINNVCIDSYEYYAEPAGWVNWTKAISCEI
jgi:hypothetical protein